MPSVVDLLTRFVFVSLSIRKEYPLPSGGGGKASLWWPSLTGGLDDSSWTVMQEKMLGQLGFIDPSLVVRLMKGDKEGEIING